MRFLTDRVVPAGAVLVAGLVLAFVARAVVARHPVGDLGDQGVEVGAAGERREPAHAQDLIAASSSRRARCRRLLTAEMDRSRASAISS